MFVSFANPLQTAYVMTIRVMVRVRVRLQLVRVPNRNKGMTEVAGAATQLIGNVYR